MRQDTNNLEIIKDKVRKLLALSKSDNENKAAVALEKANELISKYELDEMKPTDEKGLEDTINQQQEFVWTENKHKQSSSEPDETLRHTFADGPAIFGIMYPSSKENPETTIIFRRDPNGSEAKVNLKRNTDTAEMLVANTIKHFDQEQDITLFDVGEYLCSQITKIYQKEGLHPQRCRYRNITKEDLTTWEILARKEFLKEDFCSADYLLKDWDKIEGWILYTQNNKWIGCCFNDWRCHDFNPYGCHFLEACVFPEFRGKGYGKYLIKINFDHAVGYKKSVCINPGNTASIALCTKYGFRPVRPHKCWTLFISDEDYPPELKKISFG